MTTKRPAKPTATTEPTQPTPDPRGKAIGEFMLEVARSMPVLQWCKCRIRYGVGSTEAGENPEVLTLVVANELHRREHGRDNWDHFEQLTSSDLGAYVEAAFDAEATLTDAEPEAAEATKGDMV